MESRTSFSLQQDSLGKKVSYLDGFESLSVSEEGEAVILDLSCDLELNSDGVLYQQPLYGQVIAFLEGVLRYYGIFSFFYYGINSFEDEGLGVFVNPEVDEFVARISYTKQRFSSDYSFLNELVMNTFKKDDGVGLG